MTTTPDDWTLINRVRKDPDALGELFRRHRDFVYRICWSQLRQREAADDATQDVFFRLARQRRALQAKAQFRTWLYRVASNTCRDLMRKARRSPAPIHDDSQLNTPDHSASAETHTRMAELEQALEQLSERQREVVVLRVLEGFDTHETATALGVSEGSIKTHLHRALAALRGKLT